MHSYLAVLWFCNDWGSEFFYRKALPLESNFATSALKIVKQIAGQRHLSFHTVMTHRKNIFRKLNVTNVSELMMHSIKAGWIDNIEYYI